MAVTATRARQAGEEAGEAAEDEREGGEVHVKINALTGLAQ